MTKYIKIDDAYVNTAYITSVVEETHISKQDDEFVTLKRVAIRTANGDFFTLTVHSMMP